MKKLLLLFAVVLSCTIYACKKDAGNPNTANVTVKMTDAPGPYTAVILNIKSVVVVTDAGEQTLNVNDSGNRVIVGGVSYDLTTPSGQTSGVKLNVHDNLTAGIAYTLHLDFDAAQSIVLTGSGKYVLKPVVRAFADAVSGALTGMVTPVAASPKVYAIMGTDTVGTVADATGKFYFPGLNAGTYNVLFVPVSPYVNKTVTGVTVTTGTVKDMGTVTIQ